MKPILHTRMKKMLSRVTKNTMGWRIRKARLERGFTQRELGKKIELTKSFISLLEDNRTAPSVDTVIKIARVFRMSLDYIFLGKGGR